MRKFVVLSIDGGGIRGIIPTVFLATLKDMLENQGQIKPFHKVFDLMAGTSTGGLIALALSVPLFSSSDGEIYDKEGGVIPQQLPDLYQTLGDSVFPDNRHRVRKTIRQIFTSKYSSQPFFMVLKNIFKNCTIKNALTNILVPAFDMESMQPIFIKKRTTDAGGNTDPDFYMADAALATAAVPTYFPPAYIGHVNDTCTRYCLVDGGIFCINPAMSALTEARKMCTDCEYIILSLGTGTQIEDYKSQSIRRWGFFDWIAPWLGVPLISAVGEGQRISTNHMLKNILRLLCIVLILNLIRGRAYRRWQQ